MDLSALALADLLCDKGIPMKDILDHLCSGGSVPSLVVGHAGDDNMKTFDLSNLLEF
jgi:hypothetical protein